jgi:uncharacterized protein YggE
MGQIRLAAPALLGLLLPALGAAQARGEPPRPVPAITVQGTAEVRVDPEVSTVRLGVVAQGPTAQAAQERASRTAAAILAAVRALGVPASEVQTSSLSLEPLYPNNPRQPDQEPRIVGYQATNTVAVRLDSIDSKAAMDKVGPVIDAGLHAGANRVDGIDFGLRDEGPAQARALAQAVAQARQKAQAIAGALNVHLGEVLAAEEGGGEVVPRFAAQSFAKSAAGVATPVAAGQIAVSATVTLRYRIAP